MATTVAQVQQVASEFASTSDEIIQSYIDIAANYVSLAYWGEDRFNYIHALMTAHLMKQVLGGGSGTGPVTSERLGDISVSYAASASAADELASTCYGALITQLRRSILQTPMGY